MTNSIDPIETALLVTRHLDALGVLHTIGGSIASSFAGEPRSTVAIDVVAALEERHVESLVAALSAEFYVDADALRRAVRTHSTANLIHRSTQLKVDLFVAGGTPLDAQQLARRRLGGAKAPPDVRGLGAGLKSRATCSFRSLFDPSAGSGSPRATSRGESLRANGIQSEFTVRGEPVERPAPGPPASNQSLHDRPRDTRAGTEPE